jgi:uncharacterized Tic20 family protein
MSVMTTTVLDGAAAPAARRPRRAPRLVVTPVVEATVATVEPQPVAVAKWQKVTPGAAERTLGALAHLSGAVTSVAGPLVVARLSTSAYVREQATAAANFQLAFLATLAPLMLVGFFTLGIAALLIVPLVLAWAVTTLLAALAAAGGERYRYPVAPRVLR